MDMAVEIKSLSKIYHTRAGPPVKTIDDLSLSIPYRQVFGILGASGAGKTTFIKIIGGVIIPTAGEVRLAGHDLKREYQLALQSVGIVPEGTQEINLQQSVWENLSRAGQLKNCSQEKLSQHADQLLRKLNLDSERHCLVSQLSRGQQRKVAFACALAPDPPIVAFDEPLAGLDGRTGLTVKNWLRELAHEQGKAVVLATRHPSIAQELCDYIAVMDKGQLVSSLPATEFLKLPQKIFQIKVKGYLDSRRWQDWFDNLTLTHTEHGETIISGPVVDQAALHGLIARIRNLGIPLLSITPAEPTLGELLNTSHE